MDPSQPAAAAQAVLQHDLSMWALFLRADIIVKLVMLSLLIASFWSWVIIFDKMRKLRRLSVSASKFEEEFWSGAAMDDLYDRFGAQPSDPMAQIFSAAMQEWRGASGKNAAARDSERVSLPHRIDRMMTVTLGREMESLERRLGFLASVGSTAPFIGLFGTVWGIMNSFQSIAATKNTSLAVVAPGIAEALFATALGLVAAIPAVIAYNKISSDIDRYSKRLENFASEVGAVLTRRPEEKS